MRLINIESIHKDDNMKEEQTNITSDYKGDFTEIEGTPTLNGKRMGIFEKKRFNYWRERNRYFTFPSFLPHMWNLDCIHSLIQDEPRTSPMPGTW